MPNPTNADIMSELAVIKTELKYVSEQATRTNGRVNAIEDWKNALIAVDQYKKDNPNPTIKAGTVVVQSKWFQNEKLVGAVVAVLLAIAAALGYAFSTSAGGHP